LVIKSANIETKFLTENELPFSARPQYSNELSEEMPEAKVTPGNNLIDIYFIFNFKIF
jgi:hypothetical protein